MPVVTANRILITSGEVGSPVTNRKMSPDCNVGGSKVVLEPPKTLFLAVRNRGLHNPKFHSIYVCLYTYHDGVL
jgi:hypothetical protein